MCVWVRVLKQFAVSLSQIIPYSHQIIIIIQGMSCNPWQK